MSDTDVSKLIDLARDIRIAMLTTVDEQGHFTSRPMAQQEIAADGDLWFFTEKTSQVAAHIAADPHVGVTLSSNDVWISVDGTAELVDSIDKAEELWNPWVEAWLPQGPSDPTVTLIKVTPHTAEYWDTPGGTIASVISLVKSKVTGRPYEGTDNAKVEL